MPVSAEPIVSPTESVAFIPPLAAPLATALQQRGLAAPALLYLAGHRPLAFAAGQLLALAAPFAAVLGLRHTMDWARLFSTPEGVEHLQTALESCMSETRRSGNLPDVPARRDKVNRRVANPTYAGGEEHSQ